MRARVLITVASVGCALACAPAGEDDEPLDPLCADGDVVDDYVDVTSERKLEALRGCVRVRALNVEISSDEPWTLAPLASLESVETWFQILDRSGTLEGLEGLEALTHTGELRIEAPRVSTLAPLRALSSFYEVTGETESPGSVWIEGTQIESLDGLDNATGGLRELSLAGNRALRSLEGMPVVAALDRILVRDSPALTSIDPLAPIGQLGELALQETSVDDLAGLPQDTAILTLRGTPLEDLSSLAGRSAIPALHISDAPALTSLASADATEVGGVHATAPLLERVSFPNAPIRVLAVGGPLLHTIEAASFEGADVSIGGCDALGSLAFLSSTTELEALWVEANANLTTLALDALVAVAGDVRVLFNPSLPQPDAEAELDDVVIGGAVKIAGNLGDTPRAGVCPWENDGWCDAPDLCETDTADCEPGGD